MQLSTFSTAFSISWRVVSAAAFPIAALFETNDAPNWSRPISLCYALEKNAKQHFFLLGRLRIGLQSGIAQLIKQFLG